MVRPKYLVDSDWAVFYLRGKELFVKTIDDYRKEGIVISTVSIAELYEGIFRNPEPEKKEIVLNEFLRGFIAIDISKPIARIFGKRRAELRKKGLTVSNFDLLIACTAEYYNLTILTNNRKHYEKVPGVKELVSLL